MGLPKLEGWRSPHMVIACFTAALTVFSGCIAVTLSFQQVRDGLIVIEEKITSLRTENTVTAAAIRVNLTLDEEHQRERRIQRDAEIQDIHREVDGVRGRIDTILDQLRRRNGELLETQPKDRQG